MAIYGKLSPQGILTDIISTGDGSRIWPDGSTDVLLVAMPAVSGPWTYDAVNKLAVPIVPRVRRLLLDIITDINALSTAQKNLIWTDITSGAPPKWELDAGPNAAAIAVLQWAATSGVSAADILSAKIRGVAMYCADNPKYLVNPAFAPTINIPGDQPG